jgi:hypothetical protein
MIMSPCDDPRQLPSSAAAIGLVDGKPTALRDIAISVAGRTILIAGGLRFLAGDEHPRLWVRSFGAALAIEAFVLTWVVSHNQKQNLQT